MGVRNLEEPQSQTRPAQLKNQVLRIAIDIRRLTEDFVGLLTSPYRELAASALGEALRTSRSVQKKYDIDVKELA